MSILYVSRWIGSINRAITYELPSPFKRVLESPNTNVLLSANIVNQETWLKQAFNMENCYTMNSKTTTLCVTFAYVWQQQLILVLIWRHLKPFQNVSSFEGLANANMTSNYQYRPYIYELAKTYVNMDIGFCTDVFETKIAFNQTQAILKDQNDLRQGFYMVFWSFLKKTT